MESDPDKIFETWAKWFLPFWGPFYAMYYIIRYMIHELILHRDDK